MWTDRYKPLETQRHLGKLGVGQVGEQAKGAGQPSIGLHAFEERTDRAGVALAEGEGRWIDTIAGQGFDVGRAVVAAPSVYLIHR